MKNKQGISLIMLVITIIVILILSGIIISNTIKDDNAIESAREYSFKQKINAYKENLQMKLNSEKFKLANEGKFFDNSKYNKTPAETDNIIEAHNEHKGKFKIEKGKLVLTDSAYSYESEEITWVAELGIKATLPLTLTKENIGDFVNYDAGVWTSQDIAKITASGNGITVDSSVNTSTPTLPNAQGEFGGFKVGQSRNTNAIPYDSSYNCANATTKSGKLEGWRVFDIEGEGENQVITLISAGNPEDYYTDYGATQESKEILTEHRDYSMYVNSNATSATVITKARLDTWYNKYIDTTNADVYVESTFKKIYSSPYNKYETLVDNYNYYWFGSNVDDGPFFLYYVNPDFINVSATSSRSFGLRTLVTLKSGIKLIDRGEDITITDPRGNGNNTTHNLLNIVE